MLTLSVPVTLAAGIAVNPEPEPLYWPAVTLPVTDSDVNVPTVVKLEVTTLLAITVPVRVDACTLEAATPVNCEPLPRM